MTAGCRAPHTLGEEEEGYMRGVHAWGGYLR